MSGLANAETDRNVDEFIEEIAHERRKADSKVLLEMMKKITGHEPKIWGKNMVCFGKYKYQRKDGKEFEWFNVGFSPGKAHMTLYVMYDISKEEKLLNALGKHKTGRGCLYINKLDDVDLKTLEKIVEKSNKWRY